MDLATRRRIYASFDPIESLPAGDPRYVEIDKARGDDLLPPLLRSIVNQDPSRSQFSLLSGARGGGKSSELLRLKNQLENLTESPYFVLYLDASTVLDMDDVEFPDFLAFFVLGLVDGVRTSNLAGFEVAKTVWGDLKARLLGAIGKLPDSLEIGGDDLKLTLNLKESLSAFRQDREKISRESSAVVANINKILIDLKAAVFRSNKAGLVIIIDGMDKISPEREKSFFDHVEDLCHLEAQIVYTAPPTYTFSSKVGQFIFASGGVDTMVPNVAIHRDHEVSPEADGFRLFMEILERRCHHAKVPTADVFADNSVREKLVKMSGGHARTLLMLTRMAIDRSDDLPLRIEDVDAAVKAFALSLFRQIPDGYWDSLRKFGEVQRDIPHDDDHLEMLFLNFIYQYQNGKYWYEVNPVIRTLDKFSDA